MNEVKPTPTMPPVTDLVIALDAAAHAPLCRWCGRPIYDGVHIIIEFAPDGKVSYRYSETCEDKR